MTERNSSLQPLNIHVAKLQVSRQEKTDFPEMKNNWMQMTNICVASVQTEMREMTGFNVSFMCFIQNALEPLFEDSNRLKLSN